MLDAIDRDGQRPLYDVPHLLFRMVVLVDRDGVGIDLVVHKRHVVGVKESTVPTLEWLPGAQLARVYERHDGRISGRSGRPPRAANIQCQRRRYATGASTLLHRRKRMGRVAARAVLAIALARVATAPSSACSVTRP